MDTTAKVSCGTLRQIDRFRYDRCRYKAAAGGECYGNIVDYIDFEDPLAIAPERSFHSFDIRDNTWRALPPMSAHRSGKTFHLIHLDEFIYAIGGETDRIEYPVEEVERYDINQNKWETLSSLPEGIHIISAVVFKGRILVYGEKSKANFDRESLQMMVYRPERNEWQVTLRPTDMADETDLVLFCYNNRCYQIHYVRKQPAGTPIDCSLCYCPEILSVKALDVEITGDEVAVRVGEEISQNAIPGDCGAFCINADVFVVAVSAQAVCKTDIKIKSSRNCKEDLSRGKWSNINVRKLYRGSTTYLTFDKNLYLK